MDNLLDEIFEIALDTNWLEHSEGTEVDEDGTHYWWKVQEHPRQRERMRTLIETYIKESIK